MDRLADATGRPPSDPETRMELWLALKARRILDRRGDARPVVQTAEGKSAAAAIVRPAGESDNQRL
jgi:hypothetical protein